MEIYKIVKRCNVTWFVYLFAVCGHFVSTAVQRGVHCLTCRAIPGLTDSCVRQKHLKYY